MKSFKKYLKWLYSPFMLGCVVTIAVVYGALQYYARYQDTAHEGESRFFDLVRHAHQKSIDWRMIIRGPAIGHPDVAVLAIDEPSIDQEGRWPWPREKIGKVVESAIADGARTVAFDIIFSEADTNLVKPAIASLRDQLSEKQTLSAESRDLINAQLSMKDSDQAFSDTIKKYGDKMVMGSYFEMFEQETLDHGNPNTVDACMSVLHERSKEGKYWAGDMRPPVITDKQAAEHVLPGPIKDHLQGWFDAIEAQQVEHWIAENEFLAKQLQDAVTSLGLPELIPLPPILFAYISSDRFVAESNLEQLLGEKPTKELVPLIFSSFAKILPRKDQAIIQAKLRTGTRDYCLRFLNNSNADVNLNDELLNIESLKAKNPDNVDNFNLFSWKNVWHESQKTDPELAKISFEEFTGKMSKLPRANRVPAIDRWYVNIPLLALGTQYTGYFNADLDSDGTVRKNMLIARKGNHYFTSLALSSFLVANDFTASVAIEEGLNARFKGIPLNTGSIQGLGTILRQPSSESASAGFQIVDKDGKNVLSIPTQNSGRMAINYSGKEFSFPHISAADLLSDREEISVRYRFTDAKGVERTERMVKRKEFLKNKILLFGATATGVYDLRVTPFEENFPGVETHANMLSNLLVEYARANGKAETVKGMPGFLRSYPELEEKFMVTGMFIAGILLSALLSYFGSIAGLAITSSAMGGVYALDKFVLFDAGIVTTVIFPMTLISSVFVVLTFYRYFTEERKKHQLKGTFEKYVSPAIVAEILADPQNIELGGKKMELTVMFSDVRGFTTISEKLDPRALSDLLNSYLTPMTDLVFKNKGTLDKYMGDAIMAFWGAPIHFNDHAGHACRCALQMIEKLKLLQADYRARGLPEIDIGIGLNTGEMSVGNMGSDTVRSYTVMGDAVNLGSRLEGINKTYGTRIIISEFTYAAVKENFICREVDWVRVKGKLQPVRIFELAGEKTVSPAKAALLAKFTEGFTAYHERDFERAEVLFTAALHLDPEDDPSQLYLDRCQEYKHEPPPADWDGVYNLKEK